MPFVFDSEANLDTTLDKLELCKTPTLELDEEKETVFEDAIIFDTSHTAFISKEEVYAKSKTICFGK